MLNSSLSGSRFQPSTLLLIRFFIELYLAPRVFYVKRLLNLCFDYNKHKYFVSFSVFLVVKGSTGEMVY